MGLLYLGEERITIFPCLLLLYEVNHEKIFDFYRIINLRKDGNGKINWNVRILTKIKFYREKELDLINYKFVTDIKRFYTENTCVLFELFAIRSAVQIIIIQIYLYLLIIFSLPPLLATSVSHICLNTLDCSNLYRIEQYVLYYHSFVILSIVKKG